MSNISQEEHEKRLWEAYRHGFRTAKGETKGPDPVSGKMPDDPSQPGNETPEDPPQPMSRVDFVKQTMNGK